MPSYKAPFPQQGAGIGLTKPAPLPEREPTEDEQIVDRINYLRGGEGDSVTIFCDNPDFNGQPERVVECCGDWTGWEDRRYGGDTLLGALNAAWLECMQWRTALQYGREKHGPTPTAMSDNKEDADEATDNGRNTGGKVY